jgi:hypothetical protein
MGMPAPDQAGMGVLACRNAKCHGLLEPGGPLENAGFLWNPVRRPSRNHPDRTQRFHYGRNPGGDIPIAAHILPFFRAPETRGRRVG